MATIKIRRTMTRGKCSFHNGLLAIQKVFTTVVPIIVFSQGLSKKLIGSNFLTNILA